MLMQNERTEKMKEIKFRDLKANEIECRVAQCKENGLQLLLYKNARTDSTILDETLGTQNWQDKFYECKGNLFCSIGINVNYDQPDKEPLWIWKDDCGSESNQDKEKGEASDAFKRSAFKYSIGKPLYTSLFIWVKAEDCNIKDTGRKDKYGKTIWGCKDKFYVKYITYENDQIVQLIISNLSTHKDVYAYGTKLENQVPVSNGILLEQIEKILMYAPRDRVMKALEYYKRSYLAELTREEAQKIIEQLGIEND